jgi:hypothetical protein
MNPKTVSQAMKHLPNCQFWLGIFTPDCTHDAAAALGHISEQRHRSFRGILLPRRSLHDKPNLEIVAALTS